MGDGSGKKVRTLKIKKAADKARKRIKKVEAGKKLFKKAVKKIAKDTAKTVAKETVKGTAKITAMVTVPAVAVIAVLYNSPFSLFLPPLESGDTVQT